MRTRTAVLAVATLIGGFTTAVLPAPATVSVIVAESVPDTTAAEHLIAGLGGEVNRTLGLIGGVAADVPAPALAILAADPAVASVWEDGAIELHDSSQADFDDDDGLEAYDALPPDRGWQEAIGLSGLPPHVDGDGVTVAVLDTGVTRHPDLGDRVVRRVDLTPEADGYDRYGHGTHMTGIVAGDGEASGGRWQGVAPGADVVSVKVAAWNGATDVSVVLAGLEWVVAHRQEYGIRVLNLSFGTNSSQKVEIDPLNRAVERVWDAGIMVVVAAGNGGPDGGSIDKPADDPLVLTVGAADTRRTASRADDTVAPFSSQGPTQEGSVKPDLVAPGVSLVSHRAIDSTIDAMRPAAREESQYFRGTGTSQATAVVAGVAALMYEAEPSLTADEAKAALVATASSMGGQSGSGAGLVDAGRAVAAAEAGTHGDRSLTAGMPRSSGLGSIDSSRSGLKAFADVDRDGQPEQVSGEHDVLGRPWDAAAWTSKSWRAGSWSSSAWAPYTAEGSGWSPAMPVANWGGMAWDEQSWTSKSWRDAGWEPGTWTSKSWRAGNWSS